MPFPLIAALAAKLGGKVAAKKGAEVAAKKGGEVAAKKGAETAAQKGGQSFGGKALGKLGSFEKSNYKSAQAGGGQQDQPGLESKPWPQLALPKQFHKGGRVRKTGWARVRKGERVLTKKQVKRLPKKKAARKRG